jgi:hypothetical protein
MECTIQDNGSKVLGVAEYHQNPWHGLFLFVLSDGFRFWRKTRLECSWGNNSRNEVGEENCLGGDWSWEIVAMKQRQCGDVGRLIMENMKNSQMII